MQYRNMRRKIMIRFLKFLNIFPISIVGYLLSFAKTK